MIDSSVFAIDIASGTSITAGTAIPMGCIDGPSVVRSGRGNALLKRITTFRFGSPGVAFRVYVKNSDWVDPVVNEAGSLSDTTLDRRTGGYQNGNNCLMTENSSWEVYAVAQASTTTTGDVSIFAIVDIDYPSVSSIIDPEQLTGIPCTIVQTTASITPNLAGAAVSAPWVTQNTDFFKAGFEYALQKCSVMTIGNGDVLLVGLSNAAGMGGLKRIIPCYVSASAICNIIEYASKLVKGPMDISVKAFSTTATPKEYDILLDFVKHRV